MEELLTLDSTEFWWRHKQLANCFDCSYKSKYFRVADTIRSSKGTFQKFYSVKEIVFKILIHTVKIGSLLCSSDFQLHLKTNNENKDSGVVVVAQR